MNNDYLRPGPFSFLPVIVKNLLIINGLLFLAMLTPVVSQFAAEFLPLYYFESDFFIPTQLVTYQFMHEGFGHLFFNLFSLWMFGSMLENMWGPKKFLTYYLLSGIGAGALHLIYTWLGVHVFPELQGGGILVGASGAIYGLLVAYAFLFPDNYIYIYFFLPLKAKYFAIILMGFDLISGIFYSQSSNVAHFAHIGGAVTGIILLLIWKQKGSLWARWR